MNESSPLHIAVIDYEMGNLYSVVQACRVNGLKAEVTSDPKLIASADVVLLPGIGGFPKAMRTLHNKGLVTALRDVASAGTPLIGICLGQQLLMDSSDEFGYTAGLGLIAGEVSRLPEEVDSKRRSLKIPHVGWCPIRQPADGSDWLQSPLAGLPGGTEFYFVHSFRVRCKNPKDVLAVSPFGSTEYATAVQNGSVIGFQFHPERSGRAGLHIYRNLRALVGKRA